MTTRIEIDNRTDGRTRQILRDIEREEDLRRRANVTQEQYDWETMFQSLKGNLYSDTRGIQYSCLAFRPSRIAKSPISRLDPESPIVRLDAVNAVFLNPIDSRHWVRVRADRRWRLNWVETRFRKESGEDELWASPCDDAYAFQDVLPQYDALKPPIQDHYFFALHEYNPHASNPGDPDLRAPFSGKFSLERNQLHVNLLLNGCPVFRFSDRDAKRLLTHVDDKSLAKSGTLVTKGEKLARLQERSHYGVLKWRHSQSGERRPRVDMIRGDVLRATPNSDGSLDLGIAMSMLTQIGYAVTEDPDCLPPRPMSDWAPRHMIEFDPEVLYSAVQLDEWVYTPQFRNRFARALGPGGTLYVRSSLREPSEPVVWNVSEGFVEYANGHRDCFAGPAAILPSLLSQLTGGLGCPVVNPGDPIATWLPRVSRSWADLLTDSSLEYAARGFLADVSVRPGTLGYSGSGVLIDASLVGSEITQLSTGEDYVDFRLTMEYITDEGVIVCPPMRQDDWTDFVREAGGILYNFRPKGDMLSSEPVPDSERL